MFRSPVVLRVDESKVETIITRTARVSLHSRHAVVVGRWTLHPLHLSSARRPIDRDPSILVAINSGSVSSFTATHPRARKKNKERANEPHNKKTWKQTMHIVSHRAPLVRRVWRVRFLSGGAARPSDAWMLMHLVRRPVLPALGRLPVQMTIRASRGEGQKICIFDFICAFDATPNKGRAGRERQREREATKPVPLITSASSYLGECFGFAPQLAIMAPLYPSVLCCRDEEEWWDRPRLRTRQ